MLEVITEGEVAQHLKECEMSCGLSDVFYISGTHTFLTGCNPASRRDLLPRKIRL